MHKSQKRGIIFFSILAFIMIGFQIYGFFIKQQAIDFEMILMAISLVIFCYFIQFFKRSDVT